MFLINNTVQEYQWGKRDWLPLFLNKKNEENTPWAELWMGAHPKAPSQTEDGVFLNKLIEEKGNEILGKKTFSLFGRLPFLFKILAVQEPLSIQVHPSKSQAEEGFSRENRLSIPIDAFQRNYRDDNHKPEIICALEPYTAMKGFRDLEEIKKNFEPLIPFCEIDLFEKNELSYFYFSLMEMGDKAKSKILEALPQQKQNTLEWEWVMKLNDFYPGDISALAPLFLNLVELKQGDALFLPAGELHAYLSGVGIELMANSDNVLRGGLTPKNIDLNELKSVVTFKPSPVNVLKKGNNDLYPSFAEEFFLGQKNIQEEYTIDLEKEAAIILAVSGELTITRGKEVFHLKKGETLFVESSSMNPLVKGQGIIYWARTGKSI